MSALGENVRCQKLEQDHGGSACESKGNLLVFSPRPQQRTIKSELQALRA